MQRFIAWQVLAALLLVGSLTGCARTVVRKVVRGDEQGVRFYRPKPYLKITPSSNRADMVTIDVAYLPDFSEEYAARPITGLGTNETEIQLNENGTLKSYNSKTDAKFDENLEAIASLLKRSLPQPQLGNMRTRFRRTTTMSGWRYGHTAYLWGYTRPLSREGPMVASDSMDGGMWDSPLRSVPLPSEWTRLSKLQ